MGRPNQDGQYLARIREYYAQHGAMPSYAQMSRLLRFKAKNASFKLASRLVDSGHVQVGPGGRLAPAERFFELPAVDEKVPAGTGEPADPMGGLEEHAIARMLIAPKAHAMLIRVTGDSMIDAGVLDGDTAVLDRKATARDGDFVVARVDGRYTLKEYRLQGRKPVLLPHNKRYKRIEPSTDLQILGVVTGIIRRMGTVRSKAMQASDRRDRGETS